MGDIIAFTHAISHVRETYNFHYWSNYLLGQALFVKTRLADFSTLYPYNSKPKGVPNALLVIIVRQGRFHTFLMPPIRAELER